LVLGKFGSFTDTWRHAAADGVGGRFSEGIPMLLPYLEPDFSSDDRRLFDTLVPFDHWTRRADKYIDFCDLRSTLEPLFSEDGRPAIEPVLFLKISLIMFHDNLSDGQVFARTKTDLAYRRFLGLGRDDHLPDVSSLGRFRARLGADGHKDLFHGLLAQAREYGLVKDRLRIKDATHVLADIAIPAGLQLVAQARNKLLTAAEAFDELRVAGERIHIETVRESTSGSGNEARLLARVEHLRDILAWVDELAEPHDANENPRWKALLKAADVARKVLSGHDTPGKPGKIRSVVDADARRGKHGDFYDGYMVDVMIDADSELFTSINVMPANGNESADALPLLEQEQSAHGNEIEKLSIDGAGFDGPVIRELESNDGPNVKVFVPPKEHTNGGKFLGEEFELSEDRSHATCPAGEQSQYKQRDKERHTTHFRFNTETCHGCALKNECIDPQQKFGRSVRMNDFQPEYDMVRQRAMTDEYADVKRDHPKVERRLGELINRHGGRRARYRGTGRVFVQQILGAMTANMKRMIRLLDADGPLAYC
jgi:transposase